MTAILSGVLLRGVTVDLRAGEWYVDQRRMVATTPFAIRLVDVDRLDPRLRGDDYEVWVSAHKPTCPDTPEHMPCVGGYIAVAAIERHLAARGE